MRIILLIFGVCSILGCHNKNAKNIGGNPYPNAAGKNEYCLSATLYGQLSGEYRALAYQAYDLAKLRLEDTLEKINPNWPLAVIVDLDETVLDNSNFQGQLIKDDSNYIDEWNEYVSKSKAEAVPGSVTFLKYADSRHIHIFYITNRTQSQKKATAINLKRLDFPQIDSIQIDKDTNLMMLQGNTNKQDRFNYVRSVYKDTIVLQLGDNLNDFTGDFYHLSDSARRSKVDSLEKLHRISKYYIVLPNAMYGDWIAPGLPKKSEDANVSMRLNLKGYK